MGETTIYTGGDTSDTPVFDDTVAATEPTADEATEDEFVDGGESNEESDADALDAQAPHEDAGSHPI